ncbi:hypothetical protein VCHENC02_2078, partial [Vibrio harveyi]
CIKASAFTLK